MTIVEATSNVCKVLMYAVQTDKDISDIKQLIKECKMPEKDFIDSINKVEDFIADAKAIVNKIDSL